MTTHSESQPVGPLIAGLCSELLVPSASASSVEWGAAVPFARSLTAELLKGDEEGAEGLFHAASH